MASLRRTLSPVPRQGTSNTVEAGLVSSVFGFSDFRPLILGIFWPKSGRFSDRSKLKGKVWKRTFSFAASSAFGNFQILNSSEGNVTSVTDDKGIENDVGTNRLETRKLLIVVTPTYARPLQAYYLNRLAYTLKLAKPPLLWIVVETSSQPDKTADVLRRSRVMFRHLVCKKNMTDIKHRHVHQRNVALSHIETHRLDGIVYFANEENVYSIDLFHQMRNIRRFGTWTVAKQTWDRNGAVMEGPVCNGTRVIGWHTNRWSRRFRRFHSEMLGFAFNSTVLWDPKRWNRPTLEPIRQLDTVKDGFQASSFIEQLVDDESQMEGLPPNCSRIMVWNA